MRIGATTRSTLRALSLVTLLFAAIAAGAQCADSIPSSVDVYWQASRTVGIPGISGLTVLDADIARIEATGEIVRFYGVARGETVAVGYCGGSAVSIVIHVLQRPQPMIAPNAARRDAEMAHGNVAVQVQTSSTPNNGTNLLVSDNVNWSQQTGEAHFDVSGQFEHSTQVGGHLMNIRNGVISYRTPTLQANVLDYSQTLSGETQDDRVNAYADTPYLDLRGGRFALHRGANDYSFFAGITLPYYFLALQSTRDVAGFSLRRQQSDTLSLFASSFFANIPMTFSGVGQPRRNYLTQTAGFHYAPNSNWSFGGTGGISNAGSLLRGSVGYNSQRLTFFGNATLASQQFPLMQLESLFSGTSMLKTGLTFRSSARVTESFFYQHTTISKGPVYTNSGSSDYLSPSVAIAFTRGENATFTYTHSSNHGGFSNTATTGNRVDASLNSQIGRVTNTAQVNVGSVQDALQINSNDQLAFRDSVSFPIKGGNLMLGFEHNRTNPSLVQKLSQELNLLAPNLQQLFLQNPVLFVESSNLPPEVKALLAAQQPIGTTISASGQFKIGNRLQVSPNVGAIRATQGPDTGSWTSMYGYSLIFQIRPTLQLRSSMNNVLVWDTQHNNAQRTTVFSFGLFKIFSAPPTFFLPGHRTRVIDGRVFRDDNIDGIFNPGESGLAGVQVQMDGREVAVTDPMGRFRFLGVSADEHHISVDLAQFGQPVKMTTRSDVTVDMIQREHAVVNFGILDFARVLGNVYSAELSSGKRGPDTKGMQGIRLMLDDGQKTFSATTDGSGDFEIDNVPPGDYHLTVDSASVPANYQFPTDPYSVHVSPVASVVQDIPLRALRSVSGKIYLKLMNDPAGPQPASVGISGVPANGKKSKPAKPAADAAANFRLIPLAGVEIQAGSSKVMTDASGNFVLRDLPAGDLKVTIVPIKPMPKGAKLPAGAIHMPQEPIDVEGATIVISNPDVVPYLTPQQIIQ